MPIHSRLQHEDAEGVHQFLLHCHHVTTEARFLVNSLPNVEIPAARRSASLLQAALAALSILDDPWINQEDLAFAISGAQSSLRSLNEFLASEGTPGGSVRRLYIGHVGRPSYDIDLDAAQELHDLGHSWENVGKALGVARRTILNHMKQARRLTTRPPFTEVSDNDLDDLVSAIIAEHPFIGGTIVHGHLEAAGIHVPRQRITASLQRVDSIGVLIRLVAISEHGILVDTYTLFTDGQALSNAVSTV